MHSMARRAAASFTEGDACLAPGAGAWPAQRHGMHRACPDAHLREHADHLLAGATDRVLLPLGGASADTAWLARRFREVVGVELDEVPVQAWCEGHGGRYSRSERDGLVCYRAGRVTLYAADLFALHPDQVGTFDCIDDRDALATLPPQTRPRYVRHLARLLSPGGRLLLVTRTYDQDRVGGPPFSISPEEVRALYRQDFRVEGDRPAALTALPARFDGVPLRTTVWRLTRKPLIRA